MDLCWVQNAATEEIMYRYPKSPRSFSSAEFLVEVAAKAGSNLAEVDQLRDIPGMVRSGGWCQYLANCSSSGPASYLVFSPGSIPMRSVSDGSRLD